MPEQPEPTPDAAFEIDPDLKAILNRWKSHPKIKLNIFRLVSDTYRRENFHSDIIGALLDPETTRDSLPLFIDLLNRLKPELNLKSGRYLNAHIEREPGRIDVVVFSQSNKCCIIIENKINDAPDQNEQLSRYFGATKGWGYTPEAIVYLSKDGSKEPTDIALAGVNKPDVVRLLVKVPAFSGGPNDLVAGWLERLAQKPLNNELLSLIEQYKDILQEVGQHMANIEVERAFLKWLTVEGENLESAERIADLYKRRGPILLQKIGENYNNELEKQKHRIILSKGGLYCLGGFAQIQVSTKDGVVQIWFEEYNGQVRFCVGPEQHKPVLPIHEAGQSHITKIASLGKDGWSRLFGIDEEDDLIQIIESVLDFLDGK